jgi:hypothetical protein
MGKISEDVLKGVTAALAMHAPHLMPKLRALVQTSFVEAPEERRGASMNRTFTVTIAWADAEPILKALEAIEREQGHEARFADRSILRLIGGWRKFAEPRRLNPE